MAFDPTTGEVILRAAQGLTQTLQVQAQLIQQQAAAEQAMNLKIQNAVAERDQAKLDKETAALKLEMDRTRLAKEKLELEAAPQKAAEEAEIRKLRAAELRQQIGRQERQGADLALLKAADTAALLKSRDRLLTESVPFPAADGSPGEFKVSDMKNEFLTILSDAPNFFGHKQLAVQSINALAQSPALLSENPQDPARLAVEADINRWRRIEALVDFTARSLGDVRATLSADEILRAASPDEAPLVKLGLDMQMPVLQAGRHLNLIPDDVHRLFDDPSDNFSGARQHLRGKFDFTNRDAGRAVSDYMKSRGIADDKIMEFWATLDQQSQE